MPIKPKTLRIQCSRVKRNRFGSQVGTNCIITDLKNVGTCYDPEFGKRVKCVAKVYLRQHAKGRKPIMYRGKK